MKPSLSKLILFVIALGLVFVFVSLCWVGAEYTFEGIVHSSKVDGWIAGYISFVITLDLYRLCKRNRRK